jgi:endonuclease YncB( thermonuclease family)
VNLAIKRITKLIAPHGRLSRNQEERTGGNNVVIDNYLYEIDIRKVSDGDTISAGRIRLGFGVDAFTSRGKTKTGKTRYYSIRIIGINTPETRRGWWCKGLSEEKIKEEITNGKKAKAFLIDLVSRAKKTYIRSHRAGADNFGRLLGDVILVMEDGQQIDVGTIMLKEKLAKIYKK